MGTKVPYCTVLHSEYLRTLPYQLDPYGLSSDPYDLWPDQRACVSKYQGFGKQMLV